MIEVWPGRDYFWRGGPYEIPQHYEELCKWADNVVGVDNYATEGHTTNSVVFYFYHEEDATAFKLKFGL